MLAPPTNRSTLVCSMENVRVVLTDLVEMGINVVPSRAGYHLAEASPNPKKRMSGTQSASPSSSSSSTSVSSEINT